MFTRDKQEKLTLFYEAFRPKLMKTALMKMKNFHAAEDMVAETFLISIRYLDRLDPEKPASAYWYYQSILQGCISNYYHEESLFTYREAIKNSGDENDPLNILIEREEEKDMDRILGTLREDEKELLLLHYGYGLTYREIGAITGKTQGGVGVILFRARKKLRTVMKHKK